VVVANVPGVNASSVAEYAIFTAIALMRRFREIDARLRGGAGWASARELADVSRDLGGRVLGIVGFGNIGQAVNRLAQAFGMRVVATTRRPATLPAGVEALALDALMAQADVVLLCCPLNDETRGLLDAPRIALMKPDAVVINVSRGPVIDTPALLAALERGHLGGAALDVFDLQPLPPDSPLFARPNLILTPHMAGITEDSMGRMGRGTAEEVLRILANGLPVNFCNPQVEPAYRRRFPA
jgi:D-3-phosphoglycerate dehydrogenase